MSNDFRLPIETVTEFYELFGEPIPEAGPATLDVAVIPEERLVLKMKLIAEEFSELVDAVYGKAAGSAVREGFAKAEKLDDGTRDIVECSDALGDMIVVELGLAIEARVPIMEVLEEIHLSNKSKLDENENAIRSDGVTPASDGEVKPKGKILKSVNWFEPDLESILEGREPDRTPVIQKK